MFVLFFIKVLLNPFEIVCNETTKIKFAEYLF